MKLIVVALSAFSALSFSSPLFAQQADQATNNKASVVFFREGHYVGSALKPSVYVDGKQVARLVNGQWFSMPIEPGKHEVSSSAKNEAATVIEVSPGDTDYVQMVITTGTWRGGGRLIEVDSAAAQKQIQKLKPLDQKFLLATDSSSQ